MFNWNSKDHLSCILYGGTISIPIKEEYTFAYKDGSTRQKTRWTTKEFSFPRRVEPIRGTEYAKGGIYSSDDDTLSKLKIKDKETKKIIELIRKRRKLSKRCGTYYHGLPKLYEEMRWTNEIIHGQLMSPVTKTGRLASSKPNQQNMDHDIRRCIVSRYQ